MFWLSQNRVKQEHTGGKLEQKLVQSPPSPSVWLEQYIGGGGSNMGDEWGSQIGPDDEGPCQKVKDLETCLKTRLMLSSK